MRSLRLLAMLSSLVVASVLAAETTAPAQPLSDGEKRQAVAELAKLLRERYAIADVAERAAKAIEEKLAKGGYDRTGDRQAFAAAVTDDLQAVTKDLHLRFGVVPPPEPGADAAAPVAGDRDAERSAWLAGVRRTNYGFARAEILPGNVGLLELRRFQPPDVAGDALIAAMGVLANTDAVIVDLRNCLGGSTQMLTFLASYFFAKPTHLFDMEFRGDKYTEHYWTMPYVPGRRIATVPMYILTSAYNFSGSEAMAYRFQVLKRATIVGERTRGGANAGGIRDVGPFFRAWMPMGRPVDAQTETNWEGTGVEPDIRTPAREALAVAHAEALKVLRQEATSERDRARLDFAAERAAARHHPVALTNQELERFAATYGPYRVWVEGDQLRLQRLTEELYLLIPSGPAAFFTETNDPVRVEFVRGPDGRAERLLFTDTDGSREEAVASR